MSKRDISRELDIELRFCRLCVLCLDAGFSEADLRGVREYVLFGEYAVAVNLLYYVLAEKHHLVNAEIRSVISDLLGFVVPDGTVSEPASILDLPSKSSDLDD